MVVQDESAFSGEPTGVIRAQASKGSSSKHGRIPVLDGWRAVSILLVLSAHLLPLGPHRLQLNGLAAAAGMALFFTLSGFLITQFLAAGMPVHEFLARRLARILPLGWTAIAVLLLCQHSQPMTTVRNLLFVANLPPSDLLRGGEHLWSLCVEMQFYVSIAFICLLIGRRGLYLIPVLAFAVTAARIASGEHISIVTWHRIDEILAGGIIALIYAGWFGELPAKMLKRLPTWPLLIALIACSWPYSGALQYFRPYAASFLVGSSLNEGPVGLRRLLVSKPMAYIAEVSYALYVIHGMLTSTWLGSGDKLIKYAKRPLLFVATFALAHVSTRYFEQPITRAVRRFTGSGRAQADTRSGGPSPNAFRRFG